MSYCYLRLALPNCLLVALVVLAAAAGCAKKDPVTAANSGVRATSENDKKPAAETETNGQQTPADEEETEPAANTEPAAGGGDKPPLEKPPTTPPKDDLYTVPDGKPAELVAYLDKLEKRLQQLVGQLRGQGQRLSPEAGEVIFKDLQQVMQSRMTAAERILASDEAEAVARVRAVESKIDALNFLEQTGDETARPKIDAFVALLAEDKDPEVRRVVLAQLLEAEVSKVGHGEQKDPSKLVVLVKELLGGDPEKLSFEQFGMSQSAAAALLQSEQVDAGIEVLTLIGEAFANNKETELAEAAKSMSEQGTAIALQHASQQFQAGEAEARERLMATATKVTEGDDVQMQPLMMVVQVASQLKAEHGDTAKELSTLATAGLQKLIEKENQELEVLVMSTHLAEMLDPPNTDLVAKANELVLARVQKDASAPGVTAEALGEMLSSVALQAEFGGDIELASKLYETIAAAAAKIDDPKKVETITKQIDAAKLRIALVGKPLVVEGKLLDGTPFDWKKYAGKVVLVDFWATWCGPCIAEFPNIKQNYESYHEQGFEVVGVNLDDDNESIEKFFKTREELPWPTVVSPDDAARGFNTPLAKASGVTAIPFVVLVGKDGNVEAIHVRGEKLGERLEKIFGPPPSSDVPETNIVPEEGETPPAAEEAPPAAEAAPE